MTQQGPYSIPDPFAHPSFNVNQSQDFYDVVRDGRVQTLVRWASEINGAFQLDKSRNIHMIRKRPG